MEKNTYFLETAIEYYQVKLLRDLCLEKLKPDRFTDQNVTTLLDLAVKVKCKDIVTATLVYFCRNARNLIGLESFLILRPECLYAILEQDDLRVESELQLFNALLGWGKADCCRNGLDPEVTENLRNGLEKALSLIRFPMMTNSELADHVVLTGVLSYEDLQALFTFIDISMEERTSLPRGRFNPSRRNYYVSDQKDEEENVQIELILEGENKPEEPDDQTYDGDDKPKMETQDLPKPVLNSLVLDRIFSNLDIKTLKTCRLICKTWNETSMRILSTQNNGSGLGLLLFDPLEDENLYPHLSGLRIQDLYSIVQQSIQKDQSWFRMAILDGDRDGFENPQTSILEDFGYKLNSIRITGILSVPNLFQILQEFCSNLEQLNIEELGVEEQVFKSRPYLMLTPALKLTHFSFHCCLVLPDPDDEDIDDADFHTTVEILLLIIRSSPNLNSLNSYNFECGTLFERLQTEQNITRNLEHVSFFGSVQNGNNPLESLLEVEFSNSLKSLTITCQYDNPFPKLQTEAFLKIVGMTLNKLILTTLLHSQYDGETITSKPVLELPMMPNLSEFRYLAAEEYNLGSIAFLIKMPALKILFFSQSKYFDGGLYEYANGLFSECDDLKTSPHQNLRELYLPGLLTSDDQLELLSECVPNLSSLMVGVFENGDPGLNERLDGALSKISTMKKLRRLYLQIPAETLILHEEDEEFEDNYFLRFFNLFVGNGRVPSPDWLSKAFRTISNLVKLTFITYKGFRSEYWDDESDGYGEKMSDERFSVDRLVFDRCNVLECSDMSSESPFMYNFCFKK